MKPGSDFPSFSPFSLFSRDFSGARDGANNRCDTLKTIVGEWKMKRGESCSVITERERERGFLGGVALFNYRRIFNYPVAPESDATQFPLAIFYFIGEYPIESIRA